jgi:hypothetical protein
VVGLSKSFEMNDMYGRFNLKQYNNHQEFVNAFAANYKKEIEAAMTEKKYDKAETPDAIATVEKIRQRLRDGLELVLVLLKNR